jgi:type VI secretion system protein ImpA
MTMTDSPRAQGRDLAALLAPISSDRPAGEWLRFDPLYDQIRKLREADDPSLPQGVWKRELKRADWHGVAELTSQALATRSKDFQLAVWLLEAWLHTDRFRGLADGFRLLAGLSREYWPTAFPPVDGDSVDARLAPIAWAADKLVLPIKRLTVTSPASEDSVPLTWADAESALYYENLEKSQPAAAQSAYAEGALRHPLFLLSASLTAASWYVALADELADVRAALHDLDVTLVECAGAENTPSLAALRGALDSINAFVSRVLAERVASGEVAAGDHHFEEEGDPVLAEFPHHAAGGPIASRAEAFQRLREAAEFLLRTEPHSPVAYLVLRAVSWEHLPLAELLAELLSKSNDLAAVYALLGMDKEA